MKRFRYSHALALTLALLPALSHQAAGQSDGSLGGAIFLLRPVGATALGAGQAVVARTDGTESIWWNPAALAAIERRELAIHHSQDFIATGDAVAFAFPRALRGVLGLAADLQDYGEQENTTGEGEPPTGTILPRSFVLSAAYAATPIQNVRIGAALKLAQFRVDCTGPCDLPTEVGQAWAVDAGVQYDAGRSHRLTLAASVRNLRAPVLGSRTSDETLPVRVQVGATVRYPLPERYASEADLLISADVVDGLDIDSPLPRFGAELTWQKRAFLRAGYVVDAPASESGGPSLGLGLVSKNFVVDISRLFTGFSADAAKAPTYLSLRIGF